MRFFLLFFLFSMNLWARPVVVVSYYDTYGSGKFNNSEKVALELEKRFQGPQTEFDVKFCKLNTVFDRSFSQLEKCIESLPVAPLMVLGLGEAGCDLKVETMVKNEDLTYGPDNAGNERLGSLILPEASEYLGLKYPIPQMFCGLEDKERKKVEISNFAGSFVCNNTAFQLSYKYPDLISGFIHVPANHCRRLEAKTDFAISALEKMLIEGVKFLTISDPAAVVRLPITKEEIKEQAGQNDCLGEFYSRMKAAGVKRRGLGRFFFGNN